MVVDELGYLVAVLAGWAALWQKARRLVNTGVATLLLLLLATHHLRMNHLPWYILRAAGYGMCRRGCSIMHGERSSNVYCMCMCMCMVLSIHSQREYHLIVTVVVGHSLPDDGMLTTGTQAQPGQDRAGQDRRKEKAWSMAIWIYVFGCSPTVVLYCGCTNRRFTCVVWCVLTSVFIVFLYLCCVHYILCLLVYHYWCTTSFSVPLSVMSSIHSSTHRSIGYCSTLALPVDCQGGTRLNQTRWVYGLKLYTIQQYWISVLNICKSPCCYHYTLYTIHVRSTMHTRTQPQ